MKEDFLHAVWKYKAFSFLNLRTDEGESISIVNFGIHNENAGPDFLNACVKINDTTWHGHIEIHINASDWFKHQHQHNDQYHSVILHVVYINDLNESSLSIPTLSLCNRIRPNFYKKYDALVSSLSQIPCHKLIDEEVQHKFPLFLESYFIERLNQKINKERELLKELKNDWNALAYHLIMKSFGLSVNAYAFECVAKQIPIKLIFKHKSNQLAVESLLFGASGLLDNTSFTSDYVEKLRSKYAFFVHKYSLAKAHPIVWKYSKMRPSGFPDILMAFAAAFFANHSSFFNKIVSAHTLTELQNLLDITVSPYWKQHYRIGKESSKTEKQLGKMRKQIIISNAFIPLIYLYGKVTLQNPYIDKAVAFMQLLPPENNKITRKWATTNIIAKSAAQSQALIHLQKKYCKNFKCLNCKIGHQVIFNQA